MKKTLTAFTSAIAIVVFLTGASQALAGSYQVHSCGAAAGLPGTKLDDAWTPYGNTALFTEIKSCPPKWGKRREGIYLHSAIGVIDVQPGIEKGLQFTAPQGTFIKELSYLRYLIKYDENWSAYFSTAEDEAHPLDTCHMVPNGGPCSDGGGAYTSEQDPLRARFTFNDFQTRSLKAVLRCDAAPGGVCLGGASQPMAEIGIQSSSITVEDPVAPTVDDVSGALVDGVVPWHFGIEQLYVEGSDSTGIKEVRLYSDSAAAPVKVWKGVCDFSRSKPCTEDAFDVQVDTHLLSDGDRDVWVGVVDAAGNESLSNRFKIGVANDLPPTPVVRVNGQAGLGVIGSLVDSWSLSWDVPTTSVPLASFVYRVCKDGTSNCVAGEFPAGAGTAPVALSVAGLGGYGSYTLWTGFRNVAGVESVFARSASLNLQARPPQDPPKPADPPVKVAPVTHIPVVTPVKKNHGKTKKKKSGGNSQMVSQHHRAAASSGLKVNPARVVAGGRVIVSGRIHRSAGGRVTVAIRRGGRSVTRKVSVKRGLWKTTVRISGKGRPKVRVSHPGNRKFKRAVATR